MEENIQKAIVIKEGIRQKNFTIKPITPDNSEKAVKNAEQIAMMRKSREVCNFYQSFKNNFEMIQREKEAESVRAHSAKVQQNNKRPFWQRKKT